MDELADSPAGGPSAFEGRRHLIGDYGDPTKDLQKKAVFLLFDGDIEKLGKIKPRKGSKYIHSASEPFDEDTQADGKRLRAWLEHFKIPYHQIHASGHVYGAQLKCAIRDIDPAFILPVHTEHPGLFLDILPDEGRCLDGRPSAGEGPMKTFDLKEL